MPRRWGRFRRWGRHRPAIVLITGPTGSGKSSTLYGALQTIRRPELKILTGFYLGDQRRRLRVGLEACGQMGQIVQVLCGRGASAQRKRKTRAKRRAHDPHHAG